MSATALKQKPIAANLTLDQIEKALASGKLQMMRPWGDWVTCRRRGRTEAWRGHWRVHVFMENRVEATISDHGAIYGFLDVRIAA